NPSFAAVAFVIVIRKPRSTAIHSGWGSSRQLDSPPCCDRERLCTTGAAEIAWIARGTRVALGAGWSPVCISRGTSDDRLLSGQIGRKLRGQRYDRGLRRFEASSDREVRGRSSHH